MQSLRCNFFFIFIFCLVRKKSFLRKVKKRTLRPISSYLNLAKGKNVSRTSNLPRLSRVPPRKRDEMRKFTIMIAK